MIKPHEIEDGLPIFKPEDLTDDGLPILKKKEVSLPSGIPAGWYGEDTRVPSKNFSPFGSLSKSTLKTLPNKSNIDYNPYKFDQKEIDDKAISYVKEIDANDPDPFKTIANKPERKSGDNFAKHAAVNIAVNEILPDGFEAKKILANPEVVNDQSNETRKIVAGRAKEIADNYDEIANNLKDIDGLYAKQKFYQAAIKQMAKENPVFAKELKTTGLDLNDVFIADKLNSFKVGQAVENFVRDKNVQAYATKENPNLAPVIHGLYDNLLTDLPQYGINTVANKVSQARLKSVGAKLADWTESKDDYEMTNKIADEVLTPQEKQVYDNYIRNNQDEHLDKPSIVASLAKSIKDTFSGTAEWLKQPLTPSSEVVKNKWEDEAKNVSSNPNGFYKTALDATQAIGLVATMAATGNATGLGAVPNTVLTFGGEAIKHNREKYPDSPVKALLGAGLETSLYSALSKNIFPAKELQQAIKSVRPELSKIVTNLSDGAITKEAARQELQTTTKKLFDLAGGTLTKTGKITAELEGIKGVIRGFDKLTMDDETFEHYHPEGEFDPIHTFLTNLPLGGFGKYGENKVKNREVSESLYQAASNPKRVDSAIDKASVTDLSHASVIEAKSNLNFLSKVKQALDKEGMSEDKQKRYLFEAIQEKLKLEKSESEESTLSKDAKEDIKEHQEIKQRILKGEDPETIVTEREQKQIEEKEKLEVELKRLNEDNQRDNEKIDADIEDAKKELGGLDGRKTENKSKVNSLKDKVKDLEIKKKRLNEDHETKVKKLKPKEEVPVNEDFKAASEAAWVDIQDPNIAKLFAENPEQGLKEAAQQLNASKTEAETARKVYGDTISDIALKLYPKEKVAEQQSSPQANTEQPTGEGGVVEFSKVGQTRVMYDRANKKFSFETPTGRISSPRQQKLTASRITPRYFRTWWKEFATPEQKDHLRNIEGEFMDLQRRAQDYEYADDIDTFLMREIRDVKFEPEIMKDLTDVQKSKWTTDKVDNIREGFNLDTFVKDILGVGEEDGRLSQEGFHGFDEQDIMNRIKDIIQRYPEGIRKKDITDRIKEDNPVHSLEKLEEEFLDLTGLDLNKSFEIYGEERESLDKRQAEVPVSTKAPETTKAAAAETGEPKAEPPKVEEPPPPPGEPPVAEAAGEGQERTTGITHAQMDETARELGWEEYQQDPEKVATWDKDVQYRLDNNPNAIQDMLNRLRNGEVYDPVDQRMMIRYAASLKAKVEAEPTKENLDALRRAMNISNIAGRYLGKALVARKGEVPVTNTLTNFLLGKEAAQGFPLSEKQVKEEAAKYEELKEANKKLQEQLDKEREQHKKDIAELGLNKAKAKAKKESKKTTEEYKEERKKSVDAAREALRKLRSGESGVTVRIAPLNEIAAIAPHVKDFMKSLLDQGVDKLDDIVTAIHAEFKELVDGLTKSDVMGIIGGEHDTKKEPTRNEKARQIRALEKEAKLIREIEKERKGLEKKKGTPKEQESTPRLEELKKKRQELREKNKQQDVDEAPEDKTAGEGEYNAKLEKQLQAKVDKLKQDIKEGKFAKAEKPQPVFKKSRLAQLLEDKVIDLENKIRHERSKEEYNKRSTARKVYDKVMEWLGLRRLIQTAVDISIPFRQGVTLFQPRQIDVWGKAFMANLRSIFSPKKFDRINYAIRKDHQYHEMVKDNVIFNDLGSADPDLHNEDFRKSFFYKIPILSEPVKASNRSADAFLNVARYELYKKMRANLEKQGLTRDADPEAFQMMGNWVMNMTGRGKLNKIFEGKNMRTVLGNTFYGANLMASRFNLLNPLTYFNPKIPKEVRYQSMKDMASFTVTTMVMGSALAAMGGKISLDPDDSDFLQIRFGDKVYDITGGLANYVRTFLRMVKAGYTKATESKYVGKKATEDAAMSSLNFLRNKLAPNTAYAIDAFFGKNYGQKFDPYDIVKIYPMYGDDAIKALKEEGLTSLATVLLPNILGVGYGSYASKGSIDQSLKELEERNMRSDETNMEEIKNYNAGGRLLTRDEKKKYAKERDRQIGEGLKDLSKNGALVIRNGEPTQVPYKKLTKEEVAKEVGSIKSAATIKVKKELFGEKSEDEKKLENELEKAREEQKKEKEE